VGDSGLITTVAGGGSQYPGDGSPATDAELDGPSCVALDGFGNIYIADYFHSRIRKVSTNGVITTVAGGGGAYPGDGGQATNAALDDPYAVVPDAYGNLFISDTFHGRIRKVTIEGPTLLVTNLGAGNAGKYDVVVTGPYGSVTSSVAVLETVNITQQPQSQTNLAGNLSVLVVSANDVGTSPPNALTYQWQFDGTNISSATGSAYTLHNMASSNSGGYDVVLSDPFGSVTSSVATVLVAFRPSITNQPQSQTVAAGGSAFFNVVAGGTAPLNYQWVFDGAALPGQTNSALDISSVTPTNAGSYQVFVTNSYGTTLSSAAVLVVVLPPQNLAASLGPGPGSVVFRFSGTPGTNYVLQATTNLAPPVQWVPVFTNAADTNGNWTFIDTQVSQYSQRFYRALLP
jgi:hypothetical protein